MTTYTFRSPYDETVYTGTDLEEVLQEMADDGLMDDEAERWVWDEAEFVKLYGLEYNAATLLRNTDRAAYRLLLDDAIERIIDYCRGTLENGDKYGPYELKIEEVEDPAA